MMRRGSKPKKLFARCKSTQEFLTDGEPYGDDIPKSFKRILNYEAFREKKFNTKERRKIHPKVNIENDGINKIKGTAVATNLSINVGEKLSDYATRVNQALPLRGLVRKVPLGGKDITKPNVEVKSTLNNDESGIPGKKRTYERAGQKQKVLLTFRERRRLRKLEARRAHQLEMLHKKLELRRERQRVIREREEEIRQKILRQCGVPDDVLFDIEYAEYDADDIWDEEEGKNHKKDTNPWAVLDERKRVSHGLHDVVDAPPRFTVTPRQVFKRKTGSVVLPN